MNQGCLVAAGVALSFLAAAGPGRGQELPTGLEIGGVPVLNFDSDEGFGFGALAEFYHYGDGSVAPYRWSTRSVVMFTSKGRRELTFFVDAPGVLPGGWRFDAYLGSDRFIASPYYGLGNDAVFDEALVTDADPYYYRFGRTRTGGSVNLQHAIAGAPLRFLVGAGASKVTLDATPKDEGTTLLVQDLAAGVDPGEGWYNHVRAGLVWDTRDRETGPTRGSWTELLVQRVDESLGSERSYTRWTFADRRYLPIGERLVFANRIILQGVEGDAPFHELNRVQTSFRQQEGLGGSKTLRGVLKNRFTGSGLAIWNAELRWRAADFSLLGRGSHLVLSTFLDSGRVWADGVDLGSIGDGLHHGYGVGTRLGFGRDFVVAVDVGTSAETSAQLYIGLGYLY